MQYNNPSNNFQQKVPTQKMVQTHPGMHKQMPTQGASNMPQPQPGVPHHQPQQNMAPAPNNASVMNPNQITRDQFMKVMAPGMHDVGVIQQPNPNMMSVYQGANAMGTQQYQNMQKPPSNGIAENKYPYPQSQMPNNIQNMGGIPP